MEIVAIEDLAGAGGYTPARRQVATLADGTTAFVKTPTNAVTRSMLLAEIAAYEAIGPQPFCPRVLDASPERLVLEDLRHARWPPPWNGACRGEAGLDEVAWAPSLSLEVGTPLPGLARRRTAHAVGDVGPARRRSDRLSRPPA